MKLGTLVKRLKSITDMKEARREWSKLSKLEQILVKIAIEEDTHI